jgi:hypothetical protein
VSGTPVSRSRAWQRAALCRAHGLACARAAAGAEQACVLAEGGAQSLRQRATGAATVLHCCGCRQHRQWGRWQYLLPPAIRCAAPCP